MNPLLKQSKRGGVRAGAGRKKVAYYKAKVPFCLSVSRETIRDIKVLRSKGYNITEFFEDAVRKAFWCDFYATYS